MGSEREETVRGIEIRQTMTPPPPKPNGNHTEAHRPVILTGGREAVKVKEPFKPFDYQAFWKKQMEELRKP